MPTDPSTLAQTLHKRRQKLAQLIDIPVILWSGQACSRNFPNNRFPFRASSHFLYFAGWPLENTAIRLEDGKLNLFRDDASSDSILWHGEMPTGEEIAQFIGADSVYPLAELASYSEGAATIAVQDRQTYQQQIEILNRAVHDIPQGIDLQLAKAIVSLRLTCDDCALAELRQAALVSVQAHKIGMATTLNVRTEAEVRGAMEGVIIANNMTCAYSSIVTTQGEVLHNEDYGYPLQAGDLLLVDVGAETEMGWASDITRTWPVRGKFSTTQRAIYDIVLAAHDGCIEKVSPDVEYRDIHFLAISIITEGLIDLGILRGKVEDLIETNAHSLFFPHGVGHLLGLDVHDMEDLGDLAGYEVGRKRSDRFGLSYLRLNRPLKPGMVVTIEPGFYRIPALLNNPKYRAKYHSMIDWERLAQFADVRGIRIEDDVLVTQTGREVLTIELPTQAEAIEQLVQGRLRQFTG